jgi:hypothetical protein
MSTSLRHLALKVTTSIRSSQTISIANEETTGRSRTVHFAMTMMGAKCGLPASLSVPDD